MRYNIDLTTLTYLHIGSGNIFSYGNDCTFYKDDDGYNVLGIIDLAKVLSIIEEKNIYNWIDSISKEISINQIVDKFTNKKISPEEYSKRIDVVDDGIYFKKYDTIKEFLHDGLGRPYIPGSSIKGAIRTAVLSKMIDCEEEEKKLSDLLSIRGNKSEKLKKVAEDLEKSYLGKINESLFRFIHIGDAFFGENYEIILKMINLNERERSHFKDETKSQYIEALYPKDKSIFSIKIDTDLYHKCRKNFSPKEIPSFLVDSQQHPIKSLFSIINGHTKDLLYKEKQYWEKIKEKYYNKEEAEKSINKYLTALDKITTEVENCSKSECVLRIGHASGWRFITGAWVEKMNIFKEIIPSIRHNNEKYKDFDFPKSRRINNSFKLLGFVKLSLREE